MCIPYSCDVCCRRAPTTTTSRSPRPTGCSTSPTPSADRLGHARFSNFCDLQFLIHSKNVNLDFFSEKIQQFSKIIPLKIRNLTQFPIPLIANRLFPTTTGPPGGRPRRPRPRPRGQRPRRGRRRQALRARRRRRKRRGPVRRRRAGRPGQAHLSQGQ